VDERVAAIVEREHGVACGAALDVRGRIVPDCVGGDALTKLAVLRTARSSTMSDAAQLSADARGLAGVLITG